MPSATGSAPPESPVPGSARDERDAVPRAQPENRLHVFRRAREHDRRRLRPPAGEAVAVVRRELVGLGEDERVAQRLAQVVDEAGRKGHGAIVLAESGCNSNSIDHR